MAGRGRIVHTLGVRGVPGVGVLPPGYVALGPRPGMVGQQQTLIPTQVLVDQKLATQHSEIQRLLTENQRLAATHVALRQELTVTQQEVQRLQQALTGVQAEKEAQVRGLLEKQSKMETELLAVETLKADLLQARADATKLNAVRQDFANQIQTLTQELQRARADVQQVPALQTENEALRQELQRASGVCVHVKEVCLRNVSASKHHVLSTCRTAFDYEKKAITDQVEQRQAMEKNLVSMAREVEKLRAELTISDKRAHAGGNLGGAFSGAYTASELGLSSLSDPYGLHQIVGVENGAPYGTALSSAWTAYDLQRAGLPLRR
ncbi:hypothetical protein O6H91_14G001900 [Diphasiastrum complanatum]|uniref:Uncharacterized protein n=1 Tax=Diphasiastrum complanatum TaxID=34168 RepID=A0ACC2BLI5_DIPCM|nr:hypothetical protein O6H91_14G001900 [Diphasiastrum complanatum]